METIVKYSIFTIQSYIKLPITSDNYYMHDVYVCNLNNNVVKTIMAGELSLFNMQEIFSGNEDNCKQAIKRFCDNQIASWQELKYMVDR